MVSIQFHCQLISNTKESKIQFSFHLNFHKAQPTGIAACVYSLSLKLNVICLDPKSEKWGGELVKGRIPHTPSQSCLSLMTEVFLFPARKGLRPVDGKITIIKATFKVFPVSMDSILF
ncbi:hypothetical protein CDAR_263061 [Caerostris darwini]|uniref:Uncharacterized protein n=1 Tax=Caerostris darwini TaxID=1538125 RepID=A0AAV4RZM3_9ARAC|nr:hypothetical protein CDAR_263061 [Caerostris darwini]